MIAPRGNGTGKAHAEKKVLVIVSSALPHSCLHKIVSRQAERLECEAANLRGQQCGTGTKLYEVKLGICWERGQTIHASARRYECMQQQR